MSEIGRPLMWWTCPVCRSPLQVLEHDEPEREAAAVTLRCPVCQHEPDQAGPKLRGQGRRWLVVVKDAPLA